MTKFCKQNCMEYGGDRIEKYDNNIFTEMSGIHSITTMHMLL